MDSSEPSEEQVAFVKQLVADVTDLFEAGAMGWQEKQKEYRKGHGSQMTWQSTFVEKFVQQISVKVSENAGEMITKYKNKAIQDVAKSLGTTWPRLTSLFGLHAIVVNVRPYALSENIDFVAEFDRAFVTSLYNSAGNSGDINLTHVVQLYIGNQGHPNPGLRYRLVTTWLNIGLT